ncbi:MAG: M48 family metallopeptidase [Syntrophobacteraceae bacterium]
MGSVEWNGFLTAFLLLFFLQNAVALWMEQLNRKRMKKEGSRIPPGFEDVLDAGKLERIAAYSGESIRLGIAETLVTETLLLIALLSGVLPWLARLFSEDWGLSGVPAGLLFFFATGAAFTVIELPFGYYDTFVIEEKYGFNRSTPKLWIMDRIKEWLAGLVLSAIVLAAVLGVIATAPGSWWLWGFLAVSFVQLSLVALHPVLIAPLFNKFTPIADEALARKITDLLERGGIRVKNILQMDAGRRSGHTNAYFTGLGRTKRIVLYDTLLESHPHEEILGVLAHEAGHYRGRHVLKEVALFEIMMLGAFYLTYHLMGWKGMYSTFGFDSPAPFAGLFLTGVLWQKLGFFLKPLYMALSRRFERQADAFSVRLMGTAEPMISSLKRLASDNLANLAPHPLYVWFNYSHPPLVDRVSALAEAARSASEGAAKIQEL